MAASWLLTEGDMAATRVITKGRMEDPRVTRKVWQLPGLYTKKDMTDS